MAKSSREDLIANLTIRSVELMRLKAELDAKAAKPKKAAKVPKARKAPKR